MTVKEALSTVGSWADGAVGFLTGLVSLLLVVHVLFPNPAYNIINNVSSVIGAFTSEGLMGLLTLVVFVAIWRR